MLVSCCEAHPEAGIVPGKAAHILAISLQLASKSHWPLWTDTAGVQFCELPAGLAGAGAAGGAGMAACADGAAGFAAEFACCVASALAGATAVPVLPCTGDPL